MNDFQRPSFNHLPPGVKNILIINALFFAATFVFQTVYNKDLTELLGLYYPANSHFRIWQIVTHMFMHGGIWHIVMNMFSFYMFGNILENVWGTRRFIFFYFFTGIGAALCYTAVIYFKDYQIHQTAQMFLNHPTPAGFFDFISKYKLTLGNANSVLASTDFNNWKTDVNNPVYIDSAKQIMTSYLSHIYETDSRFAEPVVGASGAVFGVLFAFGYLFPNTILYFNFFIPIKAKYFVIGYALFELYFSWKNEAGDNVAHTAHLGGMLFAFILIFYWNRTKKQTLY